MNTISEVYPIGHFTPMEAYDPHAISLYIKDIEMLPESLRFVCQNLSEADLNRALRPDAWTLRQLIHHIADSHHHSYTRFKWALTEQQPLIKAYDEVAWSILGDAQAPIKLSLDHLSAVHAKWVYLLKKMNKEDFCCTFQHPESMKFQYLHHTLGAYAWHGNHHMAQLKNALQY